MLSLIRTPAMRGWSLVELLIGMSIFALLAALSAPNISAWVNNTRIRTVAESFQNGLQFARAEAVRRNTTVSFYMVDNVSDTCALGTGGSWVVSLSSPVGACASSADVLQRYSNTDGGQGISIDSPQTVITFNGFGRVTTGANSICVGKTDPSPGCVALDPERQLAVQVTPGGQIRMCNMSRPEGDPQKC